MKNFLITSATVGVLVLSATAINAHEATPATTIKQDATTIAERAQNHARMPVKIGTFLQGLFQRENPKMGGDAARMKNLTGKAMEISGEMSGRVGNMAGGADSMASQAGNMAGRVGSAAAGGMGGFAGGMGGFGGMGK